jgi:GNAT superfamily N-acetyltransferase
VLIRERIESDLGACEQIAHAVHELDGYPRYLPNDLRSFIASPDAYAGWVAEQEGVVLGQVALHGRGPEAAVALAAKELNRPSDQLGIIARLFVSPQARRQGVGGSLLSVAAEESIAQHLWPILDVVTDHHGAIALYECNGWRRVGEVTSHFKNGFSLDEFVYVGPGL